MAWPSALGPFLSLLPFIKQHPVDAERIVLDVGADAGHAAVFAIADAGRGAQDRVPAQPEVRAVFARSASGGGGGASICCIIAASSMPGRGCRRWRP